MKQALIVTVAVLIGLSDAAFSQTASKTGPHFDSIRIILLTEQLQIMKEYQNSLLNTVYWSLGVVAGVGFLLVGYGWFVNSRSYERDKTALKQELHGSIEERLSQIELRLFENTNHTISEKIEIRINSLTNTFQNSTRELKVADKELHKEIAVLRYNFYEKIVEESIEEGGFKVDLLHASWMLREALSISYEFLIDRALEKIYIILKELQNVKTTELIEAADISLLSSLLDQCSSAQSLVVQSIREQIQQIWKSSQGSTS